MLALENSLIYAVCEIERNGCRIDVEKLERWRKEIRTEYERRVLDLYRLTGLRMDVGSGESILKLCAHLGIRPPASKQKCQGCEHQYVYHEFCGPCPKCGKLQKQTFRTYEENELLSLKHPTMNIVVDARRHASLLSKFLDKYHDGVEGDMLRSQFHQLKTDNEGNAKGAISGRFSASGGGGEDNGFSFNAQQVIKTKLQCDTMGDHHIIRELFIPDDGCKFFSADASQIEYRLAVHQANAEQIISVYKKNAQADYHQLVMDHIIKYKPTFNDRTITKNVNFAYVFGAQAKRLAKTAGIKIEEAEELLQICTDIFPEAPLTLKKLSYQAEHQGFVSTIFGRRARFGLGYDLRFYAALNRCIQGSAADIFKVTLKALYDERKSIGIHKLRQVVHDEFDGDCLPDEQTKQRLLDFLNQQRVDTKVPIIWNLETGTTWKDCH